MASSSSQSFCATAIGWKEFDDRGQILEVHSVVDVVEEQADIILPSSVSQLQE